MFAGLLLALSPTLHAGMRVVGYAPNWGDTVALSANLDYAKLTHLNIAFENPVNDDGDLSFNPKNTRLITEAHRHHVKVLVSIGGGSASDDKILKARYFSLLDEKKRAGFAAKLAEYVSSHGFDGLDVDIEGPSINGDYGAFIEELSKVMVPKGKLLTAALSQGYGGDRVPDSVFARFDFINIMAYDATGPWASARPGQHSSFDLAKSSVAYWLGRGVPKSKAVLGVPFYGYGFGTAVRKGDYSYAEIIAKDPGAENRDQSGETIWYNGIPTIQAKTRYVVDQGLGGVMVWSLDSDTKGDKSLLAAIHEAIGKK